MSAGAVDGGTVGTSSDDAAYAALDAEVTAMAEGGDPGGAQQRVAHFVAAHPGAAEAHNDLGVLAFQAGELSAARAALNRAIALRPTAGSYHRNLALVLLEEGDVGAAVAALAQALELDPTDPETRRVLSDVTSLLADANAERARRVANKHYWCACTDTRLASADYYRRARIELGRRLTDLLTPATRLVDLGCGDGEAALDAAPHCASVVGYDVSPALVRAAEGRAREAGLVNVRFETLDLEATELPALKADALLCLGVLSCLPDDAAARLITHLGRVLPVGGLLVLRDTVSRGVHRDVVYANGYCGRYRPIQTYLGAVGAAGFAPFDDVLLQGPDGDLENHLWFLRRRP